MKWLRVHIGLWCLRPWLLRELDSAGMALSDFDPTAPVRFGSNPERRGGYLQGVHAGLRRVLDLKNTYWNWYP